MKRIFNSFRELPLAQKCVVLAEVVAIALLPVFIGMKQAQAAPNPSVMTGQSGVSMSACQ